MQVQALPGASLHDGRERVEREDRGSLCLSASGADALVSSNAILRVARRRVKLPAELHRSGVKYCYCRVPRDSTRGLGIVQTLERCGTGTCA